MAPSGLANGGTQCLLSEVKRKQRGHRLLTHFGHQRGCPETVARRGQVPAETDRVGIMDQVSPPAKISFLMTAWTPQFPSTTWVMPKSTPIVIKEIVSSSVSFLVVIRNLRILRNASRKARSTEDFE